MTLFAFGCFHKTPSKGSNCKGLGSFGLEIRMAIVDIFSSIFVKGKFYVGPMQKNKMIWIVKSNPNAHVRVQLQMLRI